MIVGRYGILQYRLIMSLRQLRPDMVIIDKTKSKCKIIVLHAPLIAELKSRRKIRQKVIMI